jgi:hypothetical protein
MPNSKRYKGKKIPNLGGHSTQPDTNEIYKKA